MGRYWQDASSTNYRSIFLPSFNPCWWEVIGEDGELLYRHVFDKSNPNEQPFTSVSESIKIPEDIALRACIRTLDAKIEETKKEDKDASRLQL